MRFSSLLLAICSVVFLLSPAGCSDDSSTSGASGSAGAAGAAAGAGGSASGSGGTAGGSTAGGGGDAGQAQAGSAGQAGGGGQAGDARAEAIALAKDDLACTTADDCCAVIDSCQSKTLVVLATDKAKAEELLSKASTDMCNDCIPPAVQVDCKEGKCTGTLVDFTTAPEGLKKNHCGTVPLSGANGAMGFVFSCGG